MTVAFHHVGIATPDVGIAGDQFGAVLEAPLAHEETFDGMRIAFLSLEAGYLELIEPLEDGPVARFLERRGPGLHHVAVATTDIEGALSRASSAGIDLIDEQPRPGAWGHDVAFLHPSSTGGTLIEFVAVDSSGND